MDVLAAVAATLAVTGRVRYGQTDMRFTTQRQQARLPLSQPDYAISE